MMSIGGGLAGLLAAYLVITPAFRWADPVLVGLGAAVAGAAVVVARRAGR
jgi:hypothetical protein